MADNIKINLPDGIEPPSSQGVSEAKNYILRRSAAEVAIADAVDAVLEVYVDRITRVCYKYNISPADFNFAANEQMRQEVYRLLDELEEELYSLICEEVVPEKRRNSHFAALIDWMLTLGTHGWNFRTTLQWYVSRFAADVEAQIAAMRFAGVPVDKAAQKMRAALHFPYSLAEVMAAVAAGRFFSADMIRSNGTKIDPFTHRPSVGLSKVGATNLTNIARNTLAMVWMRDLLVSAEEEGRAGYYVFRGSSYNCATCDGEVGWFHPIEQGMTVPLHSHCRCFVVFVNSKEEKPAVYRRLNFY